MEFSVIAGYALQTGSEPPAWYAMDFGDFDEALSWLTDNIVTDDAAAQPIYAAINAPHEDNEEIFTMLQAASTLTWFCVVAGSHQERY
jgi:hypothetical protein